jgi:NAD(P)-dependent dehydrogenase (short-subunit alcohol dehydrogenase family)
MGNAIARRIGSGATLVLADVNAEALGATAAELRGDGYQVVEQPTDVSAAAAVDALVAAAAEHGRIEVIVHTAGLSPVQAPVEAILRVDLLGTALLLDAFGAAVAPGGAGVVIASMAGTMSSFDPDLERRLATTPTSELLGLPELAPSALDNPGAAYGLAKRGNQLRVRAASMAWGRRGARVNSISPGIISTPMGVAELAGPSGEFMRAMIAGSATGRIGTPQDIAAAVDFLSGPHSTFVTGTDVLVDGGVVASLLSAS